MSIEDDVRPGLAGYWDRFVGPHPSRAATIGTVGTVVAASLWADRGLSAPAPCRSRIALRVLAIDLWGGAWVNNTRACVRWYERPGQGAKEHLGFASLHIAHPAVIAVLDVNGGSRSRISAIRWASLHFSWMIGSAAVIAAAPRRARLPIAASSTLIGMRLDRILGSSTAAPWFAPIYYTKLLIGHAAGSIWNAGPTGVNRLGRATRY